MEQALEVAGRELQKSWKCELANFRRSRTFHQAGRVHACGGGDGQRRHPRVQLFKFILGGNPGNLRNDPEIRNP